MTFHYLGFSFFIFTALHAIVKLSLNKVNLFQVVGFQFSKPNVSVLFSLILLGFICFSTLFLINYQSQLVILLNFNTLSVVFELGYENIIIAFVEEFLIRGLVFISIYYLFSNIYISLILSSLIFSTLHIGTSELVAFISYFIAGIMYGLSFIKFKSILAPIGLHFSWNFFQSFFGFPVGGIKDEGFFTLSIESNFIFNGGSVGPEESILGIVLRVFIIGIVLIYSKYKKHKDINTNQFLKIK